ncbi:MAG TPA: hypothetical protein VMS86_06970 [Thermoanaerobaculia bacterium]|nr:hypothetical protein [Thermoanaerobaculia bacterium]
MSSPSRFSSPLLAAALLVLPVGAGRAAAAAPAAEADGAGLPEQVTYSEHVAPIFFEHCVSCHRPNDVAPMSLLSYEAARPWAKSISKAVADRAMPPWDADPRYGDFANDISLDDREIALVRRWVELGALEGDPAKLPPVPELPPPGSWKMGRQPDYVIELAEVAVPADGPDLFVTQIFGSDIPAGKWIQAIELLPGSTDVLHHVVTYLGPFGMGDDDDVSNDGVVRTIFLNEAAKRDVGMAEAPRIGGVWVAGSPPSAFPTGHGQSLAAGELFSFNMHYHPSGNAGTDRSKLGIYFGEGELEKEVTTAFAVDPGIYIPAGVADHREDAVYLFARDSLITSLLPHMHNRGKSMKYVLERPDGTREVLLDVPRYDYNWQNIYRFREPVAVPAGSLVRVEAHWDNSAANPGNPDPTIDVPWGDGTDKEMLVAFIHYIDATEPRPRPAPAGPQLERLLGLHGAEESYLVTIDGMGFGNQWGLVVPETEGEPGELYMVMGKLVISATVHDLRRAGDEVLVNAAMITNGGGARMPLGFLVKKSPDGGALSGEVFFGRELTAENVGAMRGQGRAINGQSVAARLQRAEGSAGAGGG